MASTRKARKKPDIADLYKHLKYGLRRRKRVNNSDSRGILTDRATLLTRLKKVDSLKQMLARVPTSFIKTLTVDHDKEIANHASIARTLNADVYFTRPYTSQDKGMVENRIGVIRQFFSKGTDLWNVTEQHSKTIKHYRIIELFGNLITYHQYSKPLSTALLHK